MLGAGVFSNMWASVLAAGRWYLLALGIAAAVATANALSTAQLAASHHEAGGAYAYGRAELNHFLGHLAGAGFVVPHLQIHRHRARRHDDEGGEKRAEKHLARLRADRH